LPDIGCEVPRMAGGPCIQSFSPCRQGKEMDFSARNIDKKKALIGVVLVCLSVFLMFFEGEDPPFFMKAIRVIVLSVGLGFYVWGRFFSRGGA